MMCTRTPGSHLYESLTLWLELSDCNGYLNELPAFRYQWICALSGLDSTLGVIVGTQ